jgi:pSer/pThr/pTyr-binding forkhead associated (FHA) protein
MGQSRARATLQVIHSTDREAAERSHPLGDGDVTLGREDDNTIVIASEQASRHHARIQSMAGGHLIIDLGSTNGTFVNSKQVHDQPLRHGDVIRIASTVMKYVVEG